MARTTSNRTPRGQHSRAMADPVKNAEAHGWISTGGGEILGWAEGKTALGTIVGLREGTYGPLLTIRTPRGEVQTYGCPTVLASRIEGLEKGDGVIIKCTGSLPAAKPGYSPTWMFEVFSKPASEMRPGEFDQLDIPF